jgi:hypothetical protein
VINSAPGKGILPEEKFGTKMNQAQSHMFIDSHPEQPRGQFLIARAGKM